MTSYAHSGTSECLSPPSPASNLMALPPRQPQSLWNLLVKDAFRHTVGLRTYDTSLSSLQFSQMHGNIIVMSVLKRDVQIRVKQQHDELLACWQKALPAVRQVRIELRSYQKAPAVKDNGICLRKEPLPETTWSIISKESWRSVKRRYLELSAKDDHALAVCEIKVVGITYNTLVLSVPLYKNPVASQEAFELVTKALNTPRLLACCKMELTISDIYYSDPA